MLVKDLRAQKKNILINLKVFLHFLLFFSSRVQQIDKIDMGKVIHFAFNFKLREWSVFNHSCTYAYDFQLLSLNFLPYVVTEMTIRSPQ